MRFPVFLFIKINLITMSLQELRMPRLADKLEAKAAAPVVVKKKKAAKKKK